MRGKLLLGLSIALAALMTIGLIAYADGQFTPASPQELPVVVEFNINSPDGFGKAITTTKSFDNLAVLYAQQEITDTVVVTFTNLLPGFTLHQASGRGGWETGVDRAVWRGWFPGEGKPIEIWVHVLPLGCLPHREFTLSVSGVDQSFTVVVNNPNVCTFLPIAFR